MADPSEQELDALMARLADGDRAAFEPLFAALHPRALRLARLRLEPHDADDAAQQSLVCVFARATEFEPGRPVLPWFYAIAANEIRSVARRHRRIQARSADARAAEHVPARATPESASLEAELRSCLAAAVAQLDEVSAQAIRALLDAGARPDIAGPAFRKRVSRAYARLRVILGGRP